MRQNFETNIVLSSILFILLFSCSEKKNNLWFWWLILMIQLPCIQFVLLNWGGSCRLQTSLPPHLFSFLLSPSCSQPQCQFVACSFNSSGDSVECRRCFQDLQSASHSCHISHSHCCLTTHSFSCRSSCIGAVHISLDGSSLFAVSSSLMCASSQKRDAEILLSHRPSGSADFLEFLKGRVCHYVSSGQAFF